MIFLTGWAPGPGQPQPLRPGSAARAARRRARRAGAERRREGRATRRNPTRRRMKQPRDLADARRRPRLAHAPPDHPPLPAARVGVVLANLGTPDATDYWSMRRYLSEFLSDRRVIDYPPWLWQPLLQLVDPQQAALHLRRELPPHLEPRGRREPAAQHHPRPGGGGGRPPRGAPRRPGGGRLRHALRQPLDPLGARAAGGARLRAHRSSSRSIRSIPRPPPPPPTTRRSGR